MDVEARDSARCIEVPTRDVSCLRRAEARTAAYTALGGGQIIGANAPYQASLRLGDHVGLFLLDLLMRDLDDLRVTPQVRLLKDFAGVLVRPAMHPDPGLPETRERDTGSSPPSSATSSAFRCQPNEPSIQACQSVINS